MGRGAIGFWIVVGAVCSLAASMVRGAEGARASLTIDPSQVVGRVDEKIYGQFLEHIYPSVTGGLGGELVWQRSLEPAPPPSSASVTRRAAGPVETGVATGWAPYGTGSFQWTNQDPLNGTHCQRIAAGGEE